MDEKKQIVDRLQTANSVLVTVNSNPTVDQLAACIGLTIALNKLEKHATAVFSGQVPDTLEFLRPEETLEKDTNSLRDFIIALDKSKADKLRYKVEDRVVKIFITPYRTSINENDLNFSQGDLNVDVVVALGVHEQKELDQAVTAHGRILHDATVITISSTGRSELGSINWQDEHASSLSEMVTQITKLMGKKVLDEQIATALLTGVVAATDRFRNAQTSAQTMNVSADLMAAGANQQLVTSKLDHSFDVQQQPDPVQQEAARFEAEPAEQPNDASTMHIDHEAAQPSFDQNPPAQSNSYDLPPPPPPPPPSTQAPSMPGPSSIIQPTASPFSEPQSAAEESYPTIHAVHAHPEEKKEPEPYHPDGENHHVLGEPGTGPFGRPASDPSGDDEAAFDPLSPSASMDSHATPQLLSHDAPSGQATDSPSSPPPPPQQLEPSGAFDVPARSEPPRQNPEPPKPDFTAEPVPDSNSSSVPAVDMAPPAATEPPQVTEQNSSDQWSVPQQPSPATQQPATFDVPPPQSAAPSPPSTQLDTASVPEPDQAPAEPAVSGDIDVDAARDEVMRALSEQSDDNAEPVAALNAQPLGSPLHEQPTPSPPPAPTQPPISAEQPYGQSPVSDAPPAQHSPADQPMDMPLPDQPPQMPQLPPQPAPVAPPAAPSNMPPPPPPGPPPMSPTWPGQQ